MMTPPPLAERILSWSLAPIDRHAVMGDFQEEFVALCEQRGARPATRWYWTQTLLSILPNVTCRVQGEAARRRTGETEAAQANRMTIRSKLLFVVAFVGLRLAVPDSWPGLRMGAYLVLLAPFTALLATFWDCSSRRRRCGRTATAPVRRVRDAAVGQCLAAGIWGHQRHR